VLPGLGVLGQMPKHAKNIADSIKVIFKGKDAVQSANKLLDKNLLTKRPEGVPDNWIVKPTPKKDGIKYINPNNQHQQVRVMQGKIDHEHPHMRKPYIAWTNKAGQRLDIHGNPIHKKTQESHIPIDKFKFKE
jgi:hypothetical protein